MTDNEIIESFNQLSESYISDTIATHLRTITTAMRVKEFIDIQNDPIKKLKASISAIDRSIDSITKIDFTLPSRDIIAKVYDKHMESFISEYDSLNDKFKQKVDELQSISDEYEEVAKELNQELQCKFEKGNEVYLKLEEKRKILAQRESEIVDMCSRNGITTSDVTISNSSYKLEDWNQIYDDAISFTERATFQMNPIKVVREYINDPKAEAIVSGIILVMCFVPYILDIVAIIAFSALLYSQFTEKKKVEQCAILLGLLYNVRPLEMGYTEKIDDSQFVDAEEEFSNDSRLDEINDELEKLKEAKAKYESEDFKKAEFMHVMTIVSTVAQNIVEEFNLKKAEIDKKKSESLEELRELISMVQARIKEIEDNVKQLGDDQKECLAFDSKFLLGMVDGIEPEYIDIGLQNVVIRPSHDKRLMRVFIQAMLINAFCNVKPTNLNVYVSDPNGMSQDVIGLCNQDTDRVFKPDSGRKIEDIVRDLRQIADKNSKQLRGRSLDTYNKECEETGKTPISYNLLVVLSQPNVKSEELVEFMSKSAEFGVFIWIVTEEDYENTYVFNRPFAGITSPIMFDDTEYLIHFADMFGDRVKKAKPAGLPWKKYIERSIKMPEEMWKDTTIEYIKLEPGFEDGDPSKPKPYTVGNDGDVHALAVGTSGAGKSVFLNHLVVTACIRYSPDELRLWLVDYKGSEFQRFMPSERNPYMLPHIDACLCTTDADFSVSLFHAIDVESRKRYELFQEVGVSNLLQYNQLMEREGHSEKKLPRILMVVDEFQVIFNRASSKALQLILSDLTDLSKVARAAGVHMLLCSQSMKGTLSGDVLGMFTLRFALRCDLEVSQAILGTPFAGNILDKFGTLYVAAQAIPKELQPRVKTPFLEEKSEFPELIKMLDEKAKAEKWQRKKDVIFYSEKDTHSVDELKDVYSRARNVGAALDEQGTIFFGRRMIYSDNQAPLNAVIPTANRANMICAFQNQVDIVNFYYSLQANFSNWKGSKLIIANSQSEDLAYLMKFDTMFPQALQQYTNMQMSDFIGVAEKLVEANKQKGSEAIPIFLLCIGWADAVGFGIDPNMKLTSKISTLLQTCGVDKVHFIFLDYQKNDIPTSIINSCDFKVVGKVDPKTAEAYVKSDIPSKLFEGIKDGYAWLYHRQELNRFKIYQSVLDREIKMTEVVY